MATLKDIAKKTKVSITTVSRVLNNDKTLSVSDEIRKKIIDTARNMQYKTPRNRSKLDIRKQITIAIIHWYDSTQEIDDPYYMQIRRGIQQLASKSNVITKLIYKSEQGYHKEEFDQVDGIICVGKFSNDNIKLFKEVTSRIVFVDYSPDEEQYDSIVIDFSSAVRAVLNHLIKKGYKSIGYLGGVEFINNSIKLGERRELVFRDFLFQKGLLQTEFIHIGQFSSESGYNLMKDALKKKHAEVYFCANDSIAIGALRAIHEAELNVPDDIGIIGFNNSPNTEYTYPPLSTVHVNTEFMGEQALISVVEIVEGRTIPMKKVIPTNLVLRKSIK